MPKPSKHKSDEDLFSKREKIDLFGDVHCIRYEPVRQQMVADVLLSPTDVRRLLETMQAHYANAKTMRRQQIFNLAGQLADLVHRDCSFFAEGEAYVSNGQSVFIGNEKTTELPKSDI